MDITLLFIKALAGLSDRENRPELNKKTISLVAHNISVLGQMWAFRRWQVQKEFSIKEYIRIQTAFILNMVFHDKQESDHGN